MAPPALKAAGLRKSFADTVALDGIDLDVAAGSVFALLGPNGAGKTTLAWHLNGLRRPDQGTVAITGRPADDANLQEIRQRVGLVFQDPDDQLFLGTVWDDVAFGPANLGLRGADLDERVDEALGAVGMTEVADKAPHHLSGGERRRVAIATVLAMRPAVLVLDEPTSNLDPMAQRELADLLLDLPVTQLVITHDLPFALRVCPRSVIMDGGRVVADGSTGDLLADEELLRAHRLVLPFGFDPSSVASSPVSDG
jgi:cobalt/nickel transport system ATP-binding protein